MLRRAVAINTATLGANILIQLISVSLLSRLLSPQEIGAFSVAVAFTALLTALREMGVGLYIVQEPALTEERWNSAVTLAAISSWMIGILVFLSANWISKIYETPQIASAIQLIAVGFFFVPWNAGIGAKLQRELSYGKLSLISLGSLFVNTTSSIVFAFQEFGTLSLAIGTMAGSISAFAIGVVVGRQHARWKPCLSEFKYIFSFSWRVVYSSSSQQVGGALPDLIIGRLLTLHDVAILNRANALRGLVANHLVSILQSTLQPKFAEEYRSGKDLVADILLRSRFATGLFIPVYALTFAVAESLVMLLFGAQWSDSVVIVRVLVLAPMIGMPVVLVRTALLATGRIGSIAKLETYTLASRILAVTTGALLGNIIWVAAFTYIESLIYLIVLGAAANKHFGINVRQMMSQTLPDYILGCVVFSTASAVNYWILNIACCETYSYILSLVGSVFAGGLVWLLGLPMSNRYLYSEVRFIVKRIFSTVFLNRYGK